MTKRSRLVAPTAATIVLLVVGLLALLRAPTGSPAAGTTGHEPGSGSPDTLGPSSATPATPAPPPALDPSTVLAWVPGTLPAGFATAVARLPSVGHVVTVVDGIAWLTRSTSAEGAVVDQPSGGYAIPIDVAGADPSAYAPFLITNERPILQQLAAGHVLLGSTSVTLRRLGAKGTLAFGASAVTVDGVLPDQAVGASEVFTSTATARALGVTASRYLLILPTPGTSFDRLAADITHAAPAGTKVVVRTSAQTPYLRYADAVLPPALEKSVAGEFAARPLANGFLQVDPAWVSANVETADVPILGRVTCNRVMIAPLRAALTEVAAEGLSGLIDTHDYGGCYVPRFIHEDPSLPLSHHSWGTAVDINVSTNRMGATPHQDPRLVAIFERHGFEWGGGWVVPDGMHFEMHQLAVGGP